jgi:hypothetical protein
MGAYLQRPAYQQNDYIGWITRAKMAATRQKRLEQTLNELFRGDVYMKMAYRPTNRPLGRRSVRAKSPSQISWEIYQDCEIRTNGIFPLTGAGYKNS